MRNTIDDDEEDHFENQPLEEQDDLQDLDDKLSDESEKSQSPTNEEDKQQSLENDGEGDTLNSQDEQEEQTEQEENLDDAESNLEEEDEENLENDDNEEAESQCEENEECEIIENKQPDYLDMARRIQADFDNFRRHATENVKKARIDGQASVIEVFLPCLDTFKEAKKSITDENVLKGVEMIENKINEALKELGVERLESIGKVYDPHLHNVIAVMKDEEKDNDIILEEYQAGYKFNDKVLRYAKVIVNKKED